MSVESVALRTHRCQGCGAHVTPAFARVFGDQYDRVHRCPQCDSIRRISRGSAAGLDPNVPDP